MSNRLPATWTLVSVYFSVHEPLGPSSVSTSLPTRCHGSPELLLENHNSLCSHMSNLLPATWALVSVHFTAQEVSRIRELLLENNNSLCSHMSNLLPATWTLVSVYFTAHEVSRITRASTGKPQ
ncbi:hypothetical protein J6590_103606 [Homalodisca vitripennis]|nr:hypothetical protein J6590_103606 [Homalodisca vitripennis]